MKFYTFFLSLCLTQTTSGQTKLPIIKATSSQVAINDGGILDKNAWSLAPQARPDVYTADRTRQTKWVTFYTDIDSIKVELKAGGSVDFVILLNGKDSCFTRIVSVIPAETHGNALLETHDTIPFTLNANRSIHVQGIINNQDTVNLHFDTGSFDVRLTQEAIVKRTHLLSHQTEAMTAGKKPNFNNLAKVSQLKIGKLVLQNPTILPTMRTAKEMDGRFGYNVFEGKIVEIDYDKQLLIIHSKMPKILRGYQKSPLVFIRSFPCIEATLKVKKKKYKGYFLLDTGSDKAMILDSFWLKQQDFPTDLTLLKTAKFSDPRGKIYETKTVVCPELTLNKLPLPNIPTSLLNGPNPTGFSINFLGNDVLMRFNTIIDLKHDCIYLKPNGLTRLVYKDASS